nr:hypothetical protein [Tanacetum cinerariifolium]
QQKSQTDSAQEMHMGLLDSHKNLTERVTELEAASGRSALPALSTSHDQLEERVEGVCKSQKILRAGHDTLVDQFKTSEDAQT